jgi:glycosyltransferase involved in cell wall biosynthesis
LIVGARYSEKDESRRLEDDLRAAAARLDGRVHLLGVRTDVDQLLPELTLLVHAARQEPLGRVLLEAAAAGTAIIATDVGGTREIFPPGSGAASLVSPDDATALASEIERLAGDEAERQRLKAAARERAVTAFDVARAGPALADQYREVLTQAKQIKA